MAQDRSLGQGALNMTLLRSLICSVALLATSATGALANSSGPCQDSVANINFGGQTIDEGANQVWGAEASLANSGASFFALCIGQSDQKSLSTVWPAMLGTGTSDILQAAKIRCGHGYALPLCDGTVHDAYAIGTTAGSGSCTVTHAPTAVNMGASPNASAFYQVWRDASGFGQVKTGNGATAAITPSFFCWWNTSTVTLGYFCETHDRGDECGGLTAARERFNHIRYRKTVSGTWQNAGGSQALCDAWTTYSAYHCQYVNIETFDTWSDSR